MIDLLKVSNLDLVTSFWKTWDFSFSRLIILKEIANMLMNIHTNDDQNIYDFMEEIDFVKLIEIYEIES